MLGRHFEAPAPNRVWLADITFVATDEGWLYVALVLDLFSRCLVGWAMSATIDTALTADALVLGLRRLGRACGTTRTGARSIAPAPTATAWPSTTSRCR